ncbi:S-adenosyl-L-methionine-dependent methyltransferase [Neohortaea acidophila]|uniref:Cytosine-specific methyltransferase n=1 Tax=Neohortaea acidophila TaxID=245834 RepID=A0A6A6Q3S8_9PEZI|nr:S-adenosyl-L-methionine-dependent methyltransferase [Neohortaea acidophila]KAF2487060.1 S-adenosyl-L-methionine-dependent methyltransferase [Neohortaea acidophila]
MKRKPFYKYGNAELRVERRLVRLDISRPESTTRPESDSRTEIKSRTDNDFSPEGRSRIASNFKPSSNFRPASNSRNDPDPRLEEESEADEDSDSDSEPPPKRIRRAFSHVRVCGPQFPRSQYENWDYPLPITSEADAIDELSTLSTEPLEYEYLTLDDFSIYLLDKGNHALTLTTLDRLQNSKGHDELLFNGVLTTRNQRLYAEGVRFSVVTIDGYGDSADVQGHVCIQSLMTKKTNIWYRLGRPAAEYKRFYDPFLYVAQFTKYFVEYLLQSERLVTIDDFRRNFFAWLFVGNSSQPCFQAWLAKANLRDFRTTVVAHVGFLLKECSSIDTELLKHTIWSEINPWELTAIARQPNREKKTVVTPFVYDCFQSMYFATEMESRGITNAEVLKCMKARKRALGLTPVPRIRHPDHAATPPTPARIDSGLLTPRSLSGSPTRNKMAVAKGDVVGLAPDLSSRWKSESATWYAYVQNIHNDKLDVLWLYEAQDTTLGNANYPFSNELFLSDNCSCGKDAVDASLVLSKVNVSWSVRDPSSTSGLFIRQKFRTVHDEDTYDFVSIGDSDFRCRCNEEHSSFLDVRRQYEIGDTVLCLEHDDLDRRKKCFKPAQIIDFLLDLRQVVLRRLQPSSDPASRPNQLCLTDEVFRCQPSKIARKCHVRVFHPDALEEGLPTPYNYDGAGDFFYILDEPSSFDTLGAGAFEASAKMPTLKLGWDPLSRPLTSKLKGMGIFCGGGNFDRGLEDGGAVDFQFAVDFDEHALHTYRANVRNDDEEIEFFLGSVDDYLAQAMAGSQKTAIARIGAFDVLAAGSPCPGFSRANQQRDKPKALKQCSLVASVLSYVDLYSPKYCVFENVVSMAESTGPNKDQNVFSQVLAALVAMGYQVQQFLMDSESYGSSQGRARVFIVASAPGLPPFDAPPYTHGRLSNWMAKRLGRSSNGLPFGIRRDDYTVFEHTSPLQATQDLPDIGDGLPGICPAFPDHRVLSMDNLSRACTAVVPKHPRAMGLVQAIQQGQPEPGSWCSTVTGQPLAYYHGTTVRNKIRSHETSTMYARVRPYALFPTVLTKMNIQDGRMGRNLHWEQLRSLTIMEARRAQGLPDHEVVIGSTNQQMRIIGNSVDRKVALALGLSLRQAWLTAAGVTS